MLYIKKGAFWRVRKLIFRRFLGQKFLRFFALVMHTAVTTFPSLPREPLSKWQIDPNSPQQSKSIPRPPAYPLPLLLIQFHELNLPRLINNVLKHPLIFSIIVVFPWRTTSLETSVGKGAYPMSDFQADALDLEKCANEI